MIVSDFAFTKRAFLAIPDTTLSVSTGCFLTPRGFVHLADLEPIEAWDLAPLLDRVFELPQLRPFSAAAARSRLALDQFNAARRRAA